MATTAAKKLREKREAVPVPKFTKDEIEAALAAEQRVKNSYHSLSQHLRKHVGCIDENLEPADGSILHNLWSRGKLNRRHLRAWKQFWLDVERSYGNSGPLCVSYSERVATSSAGVPRADRTYDEDITAQGLADISLASWNHEHISVQQKWEHLRKEEKGIVEQLIRDHIRVTRGIKIHCHDLSYIGSFLSGYKDNRQAIAAGVSRIQAALSNLADLYMIRD